MKARIFIASAVMMLLSATTMMAQNTEKSSEEAAAARKEMRFNKMVKNLMIDDATAAKLKPVYENYAQEMQGLRRNVNAKDHKSGKGLKADKGFKSGKAAGADNAPLAKADKPQNNRRAMAGKKGYRRGRGNVHGQQTLLTDAQVEARMEARFANARKNIDIQEKYYKEFKKILTPRQTQCVMQSMKMDKGRKQGRNMANVGMNKRGHRNGRPMLKNHKPLTPDQALFIPSPEREMPEQA